MSEYVELMECGAMYEIDSDATYDLMDCPNCDGTGLYDDCTCSVCEGEGELTK